MASRRDLNVKRNADAIERITQDPRFFDLSPRQIRRAAAIQAALAKISTNLSILRAVQFAIDSGTGFQGFKEGLSRNTINTFTRSQLRTAYQTTLQSAFNQGARERAQEVKDDRPYWIYDAVDDNVTRPSHAALDGIIREADDPFWSTHLPPNGFNCRCTFRTATAAQARAEREAQGKRGLQTTSRELASVRRGRRENLRGNNIGRTEEETVSGRPDTGFSRRQTVQNLDRVLLRRLEERVKLLPPAIRRSIRNDIRNTERRVNRWYVGESDAFGDKL